MKTVEELLRTVPSSIHMLLTLDLFKKVPIGHYHEGNYLPTGMGLFAKDKILPGFLINISDVEG